MDVLKETFLAARDSAIHCKDLPNKTDEFETLVSNLRRSGFRKCFTRKDGNGFWRINIHTAMRQRIKHKRIIRIRTMPQRD